MGLMALWNPAVLLGSPDHAEAVVLPRYPAVGTTFLAQARCPVLLPLPSEHLFTDASLQGWGALYATLVASGLGCLPQQALHSNLLEMEAVTLALLAFLPFLKGRHVLVGTYNTTVACYSNRQGGVCSPSLSQAAESLLLWCWR